MSMAWVAHTLGEPEQVRFHLEKSSFYVMQDYGIDLHRDHVIAAAHLLLLRHQTPADLQDEVFHQLDLVASGVHESAHYQARVVAKLVMGLRAYYHDLDEAERWLQLAYGQLDSATATGYDTSRIKALILDAVLHEKRGEGQKALPLLCEALEAAARTRFIRPILNMGTPVIDLLRKYRPRLSASLDDEFVRSLFLAIRQTLPDDQPTLIEPLTNREQEILELIADNQSNQAIAETLVISVATVKWHISNIYSKLGVSNRLEAVNRARQLRLFPIITPTWGWVLPEPCEVSYVCSVLLGFVQPL
jgi:ATP/maltotriose-dependent transcriptional regulator MalT